MLLHRFRRISLAIALGGFACIVSTGFVFQQIGRFAKAVEVEDSNARLRAILYADNNQNHSGIELRDPNSKTRAQIATNQNHDPYLELYDKNGLKRIELGIDPNGKAYFVIRDVQGNVRHNEVY